MTAQPASEDFAAADELCPCGTGLKQRQCCGLDLSTVAAEPAEQHADALTTIAHSYRDGDMATVRRLALEVLAVSPGARDALGALFNVLNEAGDFKAAATVVHRMGRIHHTEGIVQLVAARFFLGRENPMLAEFHSRMLVRIAPQEARAHATMGRVFLLTGQGRPAEYHLRLASELADSGAAPDAALEPDLALALTLQGRFAEAREIFARHTAAVGDQLNVLLQWVRLEEDARDFAAAFALLDRAAALEGEGRQVTFARAGLHRRVKQPEQALEAIAGTDDPGKGSLLQKGQILDSLGRYDEAFEAFSAYKTHLRAGGISYREDQARQTVEALTSFFTPGRARLLPRAEVRTDHAQPIFIVGFPRSGTTLVEQTLTSHPAISAGGELPIVHSITQRSRMLLGSPSGYPNSLCDLWLADRRAQIDTLRDLYLNDAALAGATAPGKPWFTDKMPLNETDLGLIHLLFAQSPILHLVRHPLDVVLSVFSNGLTHGYYCAYALETAAKHYALIADLIAHYRAALPLRYHAVRYEELVVEQEREVRAMLDFIGEPYDARTLAFHENTRHARTASYAQVTEKLYTRSRFRYRNYLKHLEPVIPILEPAIARLGYSIDA